MILDSNGTAAWGRVVLARAGATDYDDQARIAGNVDLPLSPRGIAEAAGLEIELRSFGFAALYSSPDEAARETARVLGEAFGAKVRVLESLLPQNFGCWQGLRVDEWRRKFPKVAKQFDDDPASVCPPSGEMLAAVLARAAKALKPVLKRHAKETALVVLPDALRRAVSCHLRAAPPVPPWQEDDAESPPWEAIDLAPPASVRRIAP